MPLISTQPTIVDGKEYPFLALNMAVSPFWQPQYVGGSIALRFTPFRYDENHNVEKLENPDYQKVVSMMDVFENGTAEEKDIANKIMLQIQELINYKGF
jgi:hypothetical protein